MFEQIAKYSKSIAVNLRKEFDKNVEAEIPRMIRRNWNQLDQGKKNDDNPITPLYSPAYAKKKGFSIPDLLVDGDFRLSIDVDYRDTEMVWGAGDNKAPFLLEKYTPDVLGLTQDNADESFENINKKTNAFINRQANKYL